MDNVTLKKKLSTYQTDKGYLKGVSDDILYEVLVAWENWTGTSSDFYRSLGFSFRQMAGLIGKAKKLKREGAFGSQEFKPVRVEGVSAPASPLADGPCAAVEIVWTNGQVIRFSGVDYLVDFLKKSA
jgi:hypothetical protein